MSKRKTSAKQASKKRDKKAAPRSSKPSKSSKAKAKSSKAKAKSSKAKAKSSKASSKSRHSSKKSSKAKASSKKSSKAKASSTGAAKAGKGAAPLAFDNRTAAMPSNTPIWPYIVAGGVLLLVIAVAVVFALRNSAADNEQAQTTITLPDGVSVPGCQASELLGAGYVYVDVDNATIRSWDLDVFMEVRQRGQVIAAPEWKSTVPAMADGVKTFTVDQSFAVPDPTTTSPLTCIVVGASAA